VTAQPGTVYLVGAGPGDPSLITRRGLELIRSADVILYDRLVAPQLLTEARPDSEIVFVGKQPGEVHSRQLVADALLVSRAQEGRSVVRLKGGDPFVFGRGSEEAALVRAAGIRCELVPGVTSAIAVPAYAGIPVTARGVASSFLVLTAREENEEASHDWAAIATAADTLVLLMGVAALGSVSEALIKGGRDPGEPAAVIEWGTTPKQRTVTASLETIADRASEAGLRPPATTVIGSVVAARDNIGWFEERPLLGRSIVVTRAADRAGLLASGLEELGAEVVHAPVIQIAPPGDPARLERAVKSVHEHDWVIFSSVSAVGPFFDALGSAGLDARALGGRKIAAVGPATRRALEARGIRPDLVPATSTAAALADELGDGPGSILWPRAETAPDAPLRALEGRGWSVEEVPAYQTVAAQPSGEVVTRIRSGEVDAVTFTSASTVRNFVEIIGGPVEDSTSAGRPLIVCIGPETETAAAAAGFTVDGVADPHTAQGLVAALLRAFATPR
jgi:uroporphyrinogen III methyltransferase/synthase